MPPARFRWPRLWPGRVRFALALCAAFLAPAVSVKASPPDSLASHPIEPPADFAGFRIPSQQWWRWTAASGTSASTRSGSNDVFNSRSRGASGSVDLSLQKGRDSDRLQHIWSGGISVTGQTQFDHSVNFGMSSGGGGAVDREESGFRALGESFLFSDAFRWYPGDAAIGIATRARLGRSQSQHWEHHGAALEFTDSLGANLDIESSDLRSHGYSDDIDASVGLVAGHVRDATTVYEAWLMERRWLADGTLIRPLSPAARQQLVALFVARQGYRFAHDRPDKAFWGDVETLLRNDGVLAESHVAAYGLYHANDPLVGSSAPFDTRQIGWSVGPFVSVAQRHAVTLEDDFFSESFASDSTQTSTSGHSFRRSRYSPDRVQVGADAEFHHPFGVRWQLDLSGSASGDAKGLRYSSSVGTGLTLRYRLGERWLANASFSQGRSVSRVDDYSTYTSSLRMLYFLEDHWSLSSTLNAGQSKERYSEFRSVRHDSGIQLGVQYGSGAFDAPGLIAPVRPLPVGAP